MSTTKYQDFLTCCKNGDINNCKILYKQQKISDSKLRDCFKTACRYGNLNIAQLLYRLNFRISSIFFDVFRLACGYGHFNVIQWLYTVYNNDKTINSSVDKRRLFNECFKTTCENGHIEIIKWFIENEIVCCSNTIINGAINASKKRYVDIVIYLVRLDDSYTDTVYEYLTYTKDIDTASWLSSLNYDNDYDSNKNNSNEGFDYIKKMDNYYDSSLIIFRKYCINVTIISFIATIMFLFTQYN